MNNLSWDKLKKFKLVYTIKTMKTDAFTLLPSFPASIVDVYSEKERHGKYFIS